MPDPIPEPTPQPSTVILYEPVEVIRYVEVPVIVEKTTNVCPVEAKPAKRRVIPTPAKVCH